MVSFFAVDVLNMYRLHSSTIDALRQGFYISRRFKLCRLHLNIAMVFLISKSQVRALDYFSIYLVA